MGVVLEEKVVKGPIDGLRGIPPEVYSRTPVDVEKYACDGMWQG